MTVYTEMLELYVKHRIDEGKFQLVAVVDSEGKKTIKNYHEWFCKNYERLERSFGETDHLLEKN